MKISPLAGQHAINLALGAKWQLKTKRRGQRRNVIRTGAKRQLELCLLTQGAYAASRLKTHRISINI